MDKYIKAESLIDKIIEIDGGACKEGSIFDIATFEVLELIDEIPEADVVERKIYRNILESAKTISQALKDYQKMEEAGTFDRVCGKWKYEPHTKGHIMCSICGWEFYPIYFNYCPNCGAIMQKKG